MASCPFFGRASFIECGDGPPLLRVQSAYELKLGDSVYTVKAGASLPHSKISRRRCRRFPFGGGALVPRHRWWAGGRCCRNRPGRWLCLWGDGEASGAGRREDIRGTSMALLEGQPCRTETRR